MRIEWSIETLKEIDIKAQAGNNFRFLVNSGQADSDCCLAGLNASPVGF